MNDIESAHEIDVEVIDRKYSVEGIERVVSESVGLYADAMKGYDEVATLPRWDHRTRNRLQAQAGRQLEAVILVGKTLDEVVPLTCGLHWYDVIMGEALNSEDTTTSY